MADSINIKATVQRGDKVYEVEGKIEGLTSSMLTVTITKVMRGTLDATSFWQEFDDPNDFEEAIKKQYVKQEFDAARDELATFKDKIDASLARLENARRLLLNY